MKRKEKKRKEMKRKVKERNPRKYVHIFYTFHTHKYGSTALVTHKHTVNDNLILYWSTVLQELGFFTEGSLYMVKTVH